MPRLPTKPRRPIPARRLLLAGLVLGLGACSPSADSPDGTGSEDPRPIGAHSKSGRAASPPPEGQPHLLPPPEASQTGLDALYGRIVTPDPVFLLTGQEWRRVDEEGDLRFWQIDGNAELRALLAADVSWGADGPALRLTLPVASEGVELTAAWITEQGTVHELTVDRPPIAKQRKGRAAPGSSAEPAGDDDARGSAGQRSLVVRVPAELLAAGDHTLLLRSTGPARFGALGVALDWQDDPRADAEPPAGSAAEGDAEQGNRWRSRIDPSSNLAHRYLDDLLRYGVTGSYDAERLGGMAFVGANQLEFDLPSDGGGVLRFRVQSSSPGPATFELRAAEAAVRQEIASHARANLELRVPAGVSRVRASVEKSKWGIFLWGAPHFQPDDSRPAHSRPDGAEARPGGPQPGDGPPETVLLITLDTTRRDALGTYDAENAGGATPRLDALAETATVFERAYSTAPWTLPSHASMMTGRVPSRHGAGVWSPRLDSSHHTLGERLGAAGYRRGGFVGGPLTTYRHGLAQGFDVYLGPVGFELPAKELTDAALAFAETSPGVPLFLFLNYFDPHLPFVPPEDLRQRFRIDERIARIDGPWADVLAGKPKAIRQLTVGEMEENPEAREIFYDLYRAEVAEMDRQLGRLLDGLDALGRLDGALVVILADHGELMGEGRLYSHSHRLDAPLIEIPLLVRAPGQQQGRRDDRLASSVDVYTTVLAAVGLAPDRRSRAAADSAAAADGGSTRLDGLDLLGDRLDRRQRVISEEHELASIHPLMPELRIAEHLYGVHRANEAHFWLWPGDERCFEGPVGAWRERACDAGDLRRARAIADGLEREHRSPEDPFFELDPEERARLQALGYID